MACLLGTHLVGTSVQDRCDYCMLLQLLYFLNQLRQLCIVPPKSAHFYFTSKVHDAWLLAHLHTRSILDGLNDDENRPPVALSFLAFETTPPHDLQNLRCLRKA